MIDYAAHLGMMWEKVIEPKGIDAPTVISTFAGGGGSSTGYMMAGFQELLAVEWDKKAVDTLRSNYPDLEIFHGDISKLSVEEALKRAGLLPGQLDVLDGSPPCQGFSLMGYRMRKKDGDDERNQLFQEYVRLLRGLRPKVFVMENVTGMIKGKMKLIFAEILRELKGSGYKVSARLLNAKYFHVPQSRERVIFIGVRDDLGIDPSHPKAESGGIWADRAIQGADDVRGDIGSVRVSNASFSARMAKVKPGSNLGIAEGKPGKLFSYPRCPVGRPAMTLAAKNPMWHPSEDRWMSIGELKRIGSFPDQYVVPGNDVHPRSRYEASIKIIGNSVPPLFMEAIARNIRTMILDKMTKRPSESDVLALDIVESAKNPNE